MKGASYADALYGRDSARAATEGEAQAGPEEGVVLHGASRWRNVKVAIGDHAVAALPFSYRARNE